VQKIKYTRFILILLAGLLSGFAFAEVPSAAEKEEGWDFSLAPYLWAAGIEGKEGVVGAGPAANVSLDFLDIVDTLEFAGMLAGEIRHGKWAVIDDFIYIRVSGDLTLSGPLASRIELNQKSVINTLALSYRVVEVDRIQLDLYGGARLWYVDTKLTVTPQRDPNVLGGRPILDSRVREPDLSRRVFQDDALWVDPVVGAKLLVNLGYDFSVMASGSFGMGASDEDWSLMSTLNYEVNNTIQVMAGYRHIAVDYQKSGFVYDIEMSGPILGASFQF